MWLVKISSLHVKIMLMLPVFDPHLPGEALASGDATRWGDPGKRNSAPESQGESQPSRAELHRAGKETRSGKQTSPPRFCCLCTCHGGSLLVLQHRSCWRRSRCWLTSCRRKRSCWRRQRRWGPGWPVVNRSWRKWSPSWRLDWRKRRRGVCSWTTRGRSCSRSSRYFIMSRLIVDDSQCVTCKVALSCLWITFVVK